MVLFSYQYVTGYTKTGLIAQNKILRNEQKFITLKKWLLDRRSRLNRLLLDDASWYVNKTWLYSSTMVLEQV